MPSNDLILTLAEVSIAYVGFAAIFGVLSSRAEIWPPELRLLFRALIEVGLFSLFLSVCPYTLNALGIKEIDLWFYSSIGAVLAGVGMGVARLYLIRTRLPQVPVVGRYLLIPVMLITFLLFIVNAIVWREPGIYVLGIVLSLVGASAIFLALIYRLFPIPRRGNDD